MRKFSKLTRYQKRHMVVVSDNNEKYYTDYLRGIAAKLHKIDPETYSITFFDDLKKVYYKKGFKPTRRYALTLLSKALSKRIKRNVWLFRLLFWVSPEYTVRKVFGDSSPKK